MQRARLEVVPHQGDHLVAQGERAPCVHVPAIEKRQRRTHAGLLVASGLVLACAMVMPSKKIADVKLESLIKKFRSKDFAKGVSRERISRCTELGLNLEEFLALALTGMNDVSDAMRF